MSEPSPIILSSPDAGHRGAGDAIKRARESQGMTLEALASMIKVTPAKLDALEQGRYDLLPDANFTRALAMTVCRALKMDPGEVLSALPAAKPAPLAEGKPPLNQPFKEAKGGAPLFDRHAVVNWAALLNLRYLAPVALLIAAALVYVLPDSVLKPGWFSAPAPAPVAIKENGAALPPDAGVAAQTDGQATVPAGVAPAAVVPAASVPAPVPTLQLDAAVPSAPSGVVASGGVPAGGSAPAQAAYVDPRLITAQPPQPIPAQQPAAVSPASGALQFTVSATSWIEVRGGDGSRVFSRVARAGENIALDGPTPLRVRIGNVSGVQVRFKGQPVDLGSFSRNNVARIELK